MAAEILVVGAGPVGLTLACELARHGVRPRIVDKLERGLPFCRAIGVTPRSLEVFEDMGIARDLIDAGIWLEGVRVMMQGMPARDMRQDFSDLPFSQLGVPQYTTERILTEHLARYGITVERGVGLAALTQAGGHVEVDLEGPQGVEHARFRYVIGCDGAHSAVRRQLGIAFDGEAFPMEFMLGDVRMEWSEPESALPPGMALRAMKLVENDAPDLFVAIPLPERGRYRVSMLAPKRLAAPEGTGTGHGIQADRPGATLADLQEVADRVIAPPPRLSDMRWSSIFRISMRLAAKYRVGNAFIAGDACHIHPPTGGQGMNTGIQDAYNLGWKLALVARGLAPDSLLDSYEEERRPVAAEVVARTTEQSINFGREKTAPNRLADTQLLVSYRGGPLSSGSTGEGIRAGDRVPDVQGLRRHGVGFPLRLFDLLKGTQHVLLVWLAGADTRRIAQCGQKLPALWPGLVRIVAVAPGDAVLEEPQGVELVYDAAGTFAAAFGAAAGSSWLIRPDNYVGLYTGPQSEGAVTTYLRDRIELKVA